MLWRHQSCVGARTITTLSKPLVQIEDATFYRHFPSRTQKNDIRNSALFPGLHFTYAPTSLTHWAVIAPSNHGKTTFLEILRGQHICVPPKARSFPSLALPWIDQAYRDPARAFQHVGFDGQSGTAKATGTRGAYLSARYESRREDTDFTVRNYLLGQTELNALEDKEGTTAKERLLQKVIDDFKLEALVDMPMSNLSNGQIRRARIAKALLGRPMILMLDEPFMGLDPPTVQHLSKLLHDIASTGSLHVIISMRPQDPLPDWITHAFVIDTPLRGRIANARNRRVFDAWLQALFQHPAKLSHEKGLRVTGVGSSEIPIHESKSHTLRGKAVGRLSKEGLEMDVSLPALEEGEVLVSMKGVVIKYGEKVALGDWVQEDQGVEASARARGMFWQVRRGQRWGVFGSNGSGKTTLISLICSDHPQTYSQPLEIFGRSRLPKLGSPGISIFDIQARIGQSSPEIHAFFPKNLTLKQVLNSAWAETFLGPPSMTKTDRAVVDAALRWFEPELNPVPSVSSLESVRSRSEPGRFEALRTHPSLDWADRNLFGQSPFSVQRVALFLRAIIRKSDLIVLDEAFSGMDTVVRDKCMLFLAHGEELLLSEASGGDQGRAFVSPPEELFTGRQRITGLCKDQALICISHVKEEIPGLVRHVVRLPEPNSGTAPQFGVLDRPLEADDDIWKAIWEL